MKTKELGRSFFIFDQLASTIVQAKEAISHDEPAGVTILARRQIAGIGRQRRAWISPRGGLWLSVVLRPQLPLEDAAKMTLCAAVAAVSAIEQCCGLCLGIKWPNDLLWQGHKVAGILAETVGEWTQRHTLIMSLGLNVNIPAQDLLEASSAISLQMILQRPVNINHLAAVFLECLEKDMCVLEEDGFESIRQAWLDRALGIGEEVVIYRGDQEFRGVMRGIAKDGCLLVSIGQQEVSFAAGEVTLHPQYSSS
ncbi:MAG: biotin--[acetyl-CoA-carboxylase] ligase [Peptococcaceae bacterium]|nr:biotin--[acetyl-CoA-carboxylase] ligase [Peptococcaceae bacterium]